MPTVLGIDEAGRGAVIGPMIMAGVLAEQKDLKKLKQIGVRDSKELSPRQREELYPQIIKIAKDHVIIKISASEIDKLRKTKNLNRIEADRMAEIIKSLKADKAYTDAPQVSTEKFRKILVDLAKNKTKIICENFADKKYVIVGAASIIAKVVRDREVRKIEKENKIFLRTGYSHDEYTINFLKEWLKTHKEWPNFVRKSWITAISLKTKKKQRSLKDF